MYVYTVSSRRVKIISYCENNNGFKPTVRVNCCLN